MGRQINVCILGAAAVFLLGGSAAYADFTHGGFVFERFDEQTGLVYGHIGGHDFLIDPITHGDGPPEPAHWSWVANPPTDAPTITTVSYFIHDHAGPSTAISATQVDRIHDAAAVWNTSGANVFLMELLTPGGEDIHVHNDTTSGCSGAAIGCAAVIFTGGHPGSYPPLSGHPDPGDLLEIHPQHLMVSGGSGQTLTMLTPVSGGVTWYSGAVPGSIGGTEHDYMTVVIQEFGHHLGLTHPDDPGVSPHGDMGTSPMLSSLSAGDVRRVLTGSDIDAIEHLYGVIPSPGALSLLALSGLVGGRRRRRSQ